MWQFLWWTVAVGSIFARAQFEQEVFQCKELESRIKALDLSTCSPGLEKCLLATSYMQNENCAACVQVSADLQNENNCGCVECIISALASKCYPAYCSDENENSVVLQNLNGALVKPSKLTIPVVVENSELTYYVDENNEQIHRPLFNFERLSLVQNFLKAVKYEVKDTLHFNKRDFPCDQVDCDKLDPAFSVQHDQGIEYVDGDDEEVQDAMFWDKIKKLKRKKDEDDKKDDKKGDDADNSNDHEDEDEGDEDKPAKKPHCKNDLCTTTYVSTTYEPKKRVMTSWKPIKITITETLTGSGCKGKVITKTLWETETETDWETITEWKWKKEHTVTATETTASPVTKVIFKHDKHTVTETEFEVSTKTKYKHDKATITETELEEVTKTKKVATDTTTVYKWKTETEWDTTTKIKKKTIPTTVTASTTVTETSSVSVTTTATAGKAKMPLLSGLGFDLLNANNVQDDIETQYLVGYSTPSNIDPEIPTMDAEVIEDLVGVDDIEEIGHGIKNNETLQHANDSTATSNATNSDTYESSSAANTDVTKSWIVSSLAALAGLIVIFTMTGDRNETDESLHTDPDDESDLVEVSMGADYEMSTEDLIDSDIRKLLNASVPHANRTKDQLAVSLVDDPLKHVEVS